MQYSLDRHERSIEVGIIEDLEQKLEENQTLLQNVSRDIVEKERIRKLLEESVSYKMQNGYGPAQTQEFITWFEQIESIGLPNLQSAESFHRWKKRFTQPSMSEATDMFRTPEMSPFLVMGEIKGKMNEWITSYDTTDDLRVRQSVIEIIQQTEISIHSLKYGKASVDLTNINIKVAIWVPVIILVATFLGTVIFETFKLEITTLIRHLLHLPV